MLVAVIGSRRAPSNAVELILEHLPPYTTSIVSGAATGIDTAAREAAKRIGVPLIELAPDYKAHGKRAPFVRNDAIIDRADMVLAFWDGTSAGTKYVIGECLKRSKRVIYIPLSKEGD